MNEVVCKHRTDIEGQIFCQKKKELILLIIIDSWTKVWYDGQVEVCAHIKFVRAYARQTSRSHPSV